MLTDLNWLAPGKSFPPTSEKTRIDEYQKNDRLFMTELPAEWEESFRRISARLGKKPSGIDTVFNYQQLISKKTADFVCGEPPSIETEQDTDKITKKLEQQGFFTELYELFIDVSRFGNAIVKYRGKGTSTVSPMFWYPVVDPTDLKQINQHVIAYPTTPDINGKMTRLYAEIHDRGSFTERLYALDGSTIGALLEEKQHRTGLDDFAIEVLTNVTCSTSIFGLSDYTIINSIVEKLIWRFSCIDNVLDKHAEPSMSGPQSAMTYDEKRGIWYLDLGKYFARADSNSPDLHYVTWDGNLESSFKEVEMLLNQLYILSEMGQAFADAGGGDSSGTALKLRLVSPRIKAARLAKLNDSRVKNIICTICKLNNIPLDYDSLALHWNDGLPQDDAEQAQIHTQLVDGGLMSAFTSMKKRGMTDAQIEAELEQIRKERAEKQPIDLGVINYGSDGS